MMSEDIKSANLTNNQYNFNGYIIFWIGQLISLLGSSIVQFAIIWWITVETESEFFLSLAALLGFAPFIILAPVAGVFVDRWSRKKVIATVDFLQALATVGLIYLFIINLANIWYVLVILTIRGALQAFHVPAVQAIIPLLIPQNRLSRINSLDYFFNGIIFLIGPVVGAILLEFWILADILWIDFITFVIAVIPTVIISIPSVTAKVTKDAKEKRSFRADFTEGIVFIKNKQGLLALLAVFTAVNFFLQPFYILLPLYVTKIHAGGAVDLASLMAAQQVGLISGSLFMSIWKGFKNNAHGVALGIFLAYVGLFVCILSPTGAFLMMAPGMLMMGLTLPIANVSSQTIWQKVVPPEKLGRVFSVRVTIAQASAPVAMALTGIISTVTGIIPLLIFSASFGFLFLCYSWFFTDFRNVESSVQITEVTSELPAMI